MCGYICGHLERRPLSWCRSKRGCRTTAAGPRRRLHGPGLALTLASPGWFLGCFLCSWTTDAWRGSGCTRGERWLCLSLPRLLCHPPGSLTPLEPEMSTRELKRTSDSCGHGGEQSLDSQHRCEGKGLSFTARAPAPRPGDRSPPPGSSIPLPGAGQRRRNKVEWPARVDSSPRRRLQTALRGPRSAGEQLLERLDQRPPPLHTQGLGVVPGSQSCVGHAGPALFASGCGCRPWKKRRGHRRCWNTEKGVRNRGEGREGSSKVAKTRGERGRVERDSLKGRGCALCVRPESLRRTAVKERAETPRPGGRAGLSSRGTLQGTCLGTGAGGAPGRL